MPKRVDRNQAEIVQAMRKIGATVRHTHMVGNGFPDIEVGYHGNNYLFEIKDPDKPPSGRKLTPDEERFHQEWKGQADVIHSAEEALEIMK